MTQKTRILRELTLYFMEKGKIMTNREYKKQDDKPLKASNIIRVLGSWGRIPRMIQKNFPEEYAIIMGEKKEVEEVVITEPVDFQKGKEEKELEEKKEAKPAVKPELKGTQK